MNVPKKLAILQPYEVVIWGEDKFTPLQRLMVTAMSEDEARDDALRQYSRGRYFMYQGNFHPRNAQDTHPIPVKRVEVLSDVHLNTARKQQTLFEDLADLCIGHSMDDVQGATVNLLLTAVQRRAANQADAERRWDELMGRGKQALVRRYRGDTDGRDKAAETEIGKRLFAHG